MEEWQVKHSGEILCVASNQGDQIASCGDDGVLLWSSDGAHTGSILVDRSLPSPVSGVCFGAGTSLYCTAGRQVCAFDTRSLTSPLWRLQLGGCDDDELNQVSVNEKGSHVAACDDAGEIHVIEVRTGKVCKTLRRQHENVCTSVQFRPRRGAELATCGLDCKLVRWDYSCGRPLQREVLSKLTISETSSAGAQKASPQMLNPPFLHQISFHESGSVLAAAAEDGAIRLFSGCGKDAMKLAHVLEGVHPSSACQVQFSSFAPDSVLMSAGNDRRIVAWNVSTCVSQLTTRRSQGKKTPSAVTARRSKPASAASVTASSASSNTCDTEAQLPTDTVSDTISHSVVGMHPTKINWLTTCTSNNKVVIADQTAALKAYAISG